MDQHYAKCLVRAILAGMMIGIGGCVYLGCEVKWVGAILFAVGLFTIFSFRLDLYTGKVGYVFDNDRSYIPYLLVVILGNFIGCLILGLMMPLDAASNLAQVKLDHYSFLQVLFKGVLCGMLMFIAADCYKNTKSFIATFVCVPVFILAGFEHSIADMFYFCSAGAFSVESLVFILTVLIGNAIGGFLIPVCRRWMYEDEAPKAS
ncbi:MAG: formate/nitrite transporter family protein [Candidatus Methanomethylophilaceae archaeon]|nr:formate/nitrite transporter family protein [Candidatus Methanomethylophilaceae archaeon]